MNAEELASFEREIADLVAQGRVPYPVHLSGGNEEQLIGIFREITAQDWVLCSWRSHFHCLLKGVPRNELKTAILDGHSIGLCFPRQKILCSAIVGGIAPIAAGLAWSCKRRNADNHIGHDSRVYCFVGDMTAESGIFHESAKYCAGHGLPVRWIIEDNGKSVCTDTGESWGERTGSPDIARYSYDLSYPHVGIGKWVRF